MRWPGLTNGVPASLAESAAKTATAVASDLADTARAGAGALHEATKDVFIDEAKAPHDDSVDTGDVPNSTWLNASCASP